MAVREEDWILDRRAAPASTAAGRAKAQGLACTTYNLGVGRCVRVAYQTACARGGTGCGVLLCAGAAAVAGCCCVHADAASAGDHDPLPLRLTVYCRNRKFQKAVPEHVHVLCTAIDHWQQLAVATGTGAVAASASAVSTFSSRRL